MPMAPAPPPGGDDEEDGLGALLNPGLAARRLIRGVGDALTPDRPATATIPEAGGVGFDPQAGEWQEGDTVEGERQIPIQRDPNEPRGIRNNNPGNIRHGSSQWAGMSTRQGDDAFVQFDTPEDGIQALTELADTYYTRHGLHTVAGFINRWAPPSDNNDTRAYIRAVEKSIGSPTWSIHDSQSTLRLLKAIIRHENGKQPYSDATLLRGMAQARGGRLFPNLGIPDTLAARGAQQPG